MEPTLLNKIAGWVVWIS